MNLKCEGNHSLVLILSIQLVAIKSHSDTCAEEGGEPRWRGPRIGITPQKLTSLLSYKTKQPKCPVPWWLLSQIWMHRDPVTCAPGDTCSGTQSSHAPHCQGKHICSSQKSVLKHKNTDIWRQPKRPTLEEWLGELWRDSHNRTTQSNEKWRH